MYSPKLKITYEKKIINLYMKKYNVINFMDVPKIISVSINMGLGDAINDFEIIKKNKRCLEFISGQKPVIIKAKKSISAFKLRKGMPIGIKVTLRRNHMWEFLEKFINIALPRVKDFRGISNKFDGNGNITIGIKDIIIFPEITYKDIDRVRGMNISILINSNKNDHAKFLLKKIGIPLI